MKTSLLALGALALVFVSFDASAAKIGFSGELRHFNEKTAPTGINENDPPEGDIEFTFDDQTKRACGRFVWYTKLTSAPQTPSGFHIHQAPTGKPLSLAITAVSPGRPHAFTYKATGPGPTSGTRSFQ